MKSLIESPTKVPPYNKFLDNISENIVDYLNIIGKKTLIPSLILICENIPPKKMSINLKNLLVEKIF